MTDMTAEQTAAAEKEAKIAADKAATKAAREAKAAEAKAAKEAKAKEIAEKKAKREAAKAAKEAAKVVRTVANGVTRPAAGTSTARIWQIADEISAKAKAPASRADVLKVAEAEGLNTATCATQYGRWRVFNGLKGVDIQGRPKADPATAADPAAQGVPAAPAAPAAPASGATVEANPPAVGTL